MSDAISGNAARAWVEQCADRIADVHRLASFLSRAPELGLGAYAAHRLGSGPAVAALQEGTDAWLGLLQQERTCRWIRKIVTILHCANGQEVRS